MDIDVSLKKVVKGAFIILIGTIVGKFLELIVRVIMVRYITPNDYGLFSMALVILNISLGISCLGLIVGIPRYVAYFRSRNEEDKVRGVIFSSLQMALITSIFCSLFIFLFSDTISDLFHTRELSTPLRILTVSLPFLVIVDIIVSIFRGFDRVDARVYFKELLMKIIRILLFLIVVFVGLSFIGILYAYVVSIILTCILLLVYFWREIPLRGEVRFVRRELLYFSIPLLGAGLLDMIMWWADTLILGYLKTPDVVGLYNAALPLSGIIPMFLSALGFIYLPIVSQFYSINLMEEIKRSYALLTKWTLSVTLPIFLIFFLFPNPVLNFFFGAKYIEANLVLQILSSGYFLITFLGPYTAILIVMGKTRFLMWISLIATIVNIILDIILIPPLGILGAAIASMLSLTLIGVTNSIKIYMTAGVHPFTKNYLKIMITSVSIVSIVYIVTKSLLVVTVWMLPILLILFLISYALSLPLTKSFDDEDIMMLLAIEKRAGVDLTNVKNVLKRFI